MIAELSHKIVNVLEKTSYDLHKITIYVMRAWLKDSRKLLFCQIQFLMQKLQAGTEKNFCWVPGGCCQKLYGCGPMVVWWCVGLVVWFWLRSHPADPQESLSSVQLPVLVFPCSPDRCSGEKRCPQRVQFVRQFLQVLLSLCSSQDGAGRFVTGLESSAAAHRQ